MRVSDGGFSSSNSKLIYSHKSQVCLVENSGPEERSFLFSRNCVTRSVVASRPLLETQ